MSRSRGPRTAIPPLPLVYVLGIWTALVSCIAFMAAYAWRTAQETRQMSDALAATELLLAREQKLSALDGLAAAAARMGSALHSPRLPLWPRNWSGSCRRTARCWKTFSCSGDQAARCRDILRSLSRNPTKPDAVFSRMSLGHVIEEVVEPFRIFGVHDHGQAASADGEERAAGARAGARPERRRALRAFQSRRKRGGLRDVASGDRRRTGTKTKSTLPLSMTGPASHRIYQPLGDPYVTTRARIQAVETNAEVEGLGLGFFIAKTLLERSRRHASSRKPSSAGKGRGSHHSPAAGIQRRRFQKISDVICRKRLCTLDNHDYYLIADAGDTESGYPSERSCPQQEKTLLIVDDDKSFCHASEPGMEIRGFEVRMADTVQEGLAFDPHSTAGLCRGRHAARRRQRPRRGRDAAIAAPGCARRRAHRLRQYRHGGDRGEARRGRLSCQARRCRRRFRRCSRSTTRRRRRRKTRCRPTACAGSTSSASTSFATGMSRKPRGGSTCTAAPCSASSPSARRSKPAVPHTSNAISLMLFRRMIKRRRSSAHAIHFAGPSPAPAAIRPCRSRRPWE